MGVEHRPFILQYSKMRHCPNPYCPHLLRKQSPAKFRNGEHRCSDCYKPLNGQAVRFRAEEIGQSPGTTASLRSVDWALLTKVNNAAEANVIQSLLEAENILVSIADAHMNDLVPAYSSILGWIKLFVPEEELDRAQNLLAHSHSANTEQISEEELTRAALASAGPEETPISSPAYTETEREAEPLKPEGSSWFIWFALALGLFCALR